MKKTYAQRNRASFRHVGRHGTHNGDVRSRSRADRLGYEHHNDDRLDISNGRRIYHYELWDIFDWLNDFSH